MAEGIKFLYNEIRETGQVTPYHLKVIARTLDALDNSLLNLYNAQEVVQQLDVDPTVITSSTGTWFSEVPKGTMDGVNKVFTTSYVIGLYPILVTNGATKDYTEYTYSNNVITYVTDAPNKTNNDWHRIWYFRGARVPGNARLFNGAGDKLNWGANAAWNIGGDLSLAFWIKVPKTSINSGGTGTIIFYGDASSGGNDTYKVFLTGSSNNWTITAGHEDTLSNQVTVTIATKLKDDTWYFIGIVRDSVAKTYQGYFGDGTTLNVGPSGSYTFVPASPGGVQLAVGVQYNTGIGANLYLNAILEEHFIWNVKLAQTDFAQVMIGNPPTTGLVLECLMGNSPEVDLSITNGSGTVTGTSLTAGHL